MDPSALQSLYKEVNIDLVLGINYFDYAHEPLEDLRKRWNIPSKQASTPPVEM